MAGGNRPYLSHQFNNAPVSQIISILKESNTIECRDATVQFANGLRAVDSVNLGIRRGERLAIVGQSGCGKTTLLRAIAGLQILTSGEVDVRQASGEKESSMSFVFQQPALLPWRRVIDNVKLPLELRHWANRPTKSERESIASATLDEVELGQAGAAFPHELSGGMQMRVSIARALVTQPSLLLLDEPFAALDDLLRTQLGDLVRRLWGAHGFTMLLVTHNIGEAIEMSDRICVMNRGKVVEVMDNPMRSFVEQGQSVDGGGSVPTIQQTRASQSGREMRRSSEFGKFYGEVSDCLSDAAQTAEDPSR